MVNFQAIESLEKNEQASFGKLITKLYKKMQHLGGSSNCFTNEAKTRQIIDIMLEHTVDKFCKISQEEDRQAEPAIYVDHEVGIKVDKKKKIIPDYCIMRRNTNKNTDGATNTPFPLYAIEAKKFEGAETNELFLSLPQHFRQLRHICIKYSLPFCNGVLTNFHQWYFVRYSLSHEIRESSEQSHKKSFEVSKPYSLFSLLAYKEKTALKFNEKTLFQVTKILEWLVNYTPAASDTLPDPK